MTPKIGAVILAAGGAKRFGTPKQLAQVNGKPMLQWVIDLASGIGFWRIVLVLGSNECEIRAKLNLGDKIEILSNHDWSQGQAGSVRRGVEALESDCDAIMFLLGDQPFVSKALVEREIEVYTEKRPAILVPTFNGSRGNPVVFDKACFTDLKKVQGDQGGRAIFEMHRVYELSWSNPVESLDIDTRSDLGGY